MAGRPRGLPKTGGRRKGQPNRMTALAREAIAAAAEGLGGATRLQEWARESPENEAAFWTRIYPRLLPVQVAADSADDALIVQVIRLAGKDSASP